MIDAVPGDRHSIVVGAGLLGLAAALALSRRGWSVTVVEAGDRVGHERAGSKGSARIFRLGYPDRLYVELAIEAARRWHELETAGGRTLLHRTGQVTFGDDAALREIATALHAAGAPAEELSPDEVARRFPSMSIAAVPVLFEADSGVLHADACLEAVCAAGDFVLRTGTQVVAIDVGGDRAHASVVLAGGERLGADVVVDCAGPRALTLAGLRPAVAAPATLPQVAYFAPRHRDNAELALPPVFIEWGDDMIYGLPVPPGASGAGDGAGGLYKVSHHTPGARFAGDEPSDAELSSDDPLRLEQVCHAVARLLPGLDPVPVATERCMYDNSADGDFVFDRVGNVVIGCGTSGHGFKFGPVLGELLADLAEGVTPSFDLARFALDRPAPQSQEGAVVR